MGFSGSKSSSKFVTKQLPGLFGGEGGDVFGAGRRIGGRAEEVLTGPAEQGAFQKPLEQAVLRPEFGPTSLAETNLLQSLSGLTQGTAALRGLGPATPAALAQTLAPALIGLQQQRVGQLQAGAGLEQQRLGQRRGQTISGLLELAGLAAPQTVGGNVSKQRQFGIQSGF